MALIQKPLVLWVSVLLGVSLASTSSVAAGTLTTQDAAKHVGEVATVCGTVASTNYAVKSKGQPTYLNLDQPYPNHIFTVVVWGSDRPKFGAPEVALKGKRVCVTGPIQLYKAKPEIIATDPRQLSLQ